MILSKTTQTHLTVSVLVALLSATAAHGQVQPTSDAAAKGPGLGATDGVIYGREPGPTGPAPRLGDGHPDLSGYWRALRPHGYPPGNIAKDLPGYKLPYSPAGEAALKYNLTTIDPRYTCVPLGIPRDDIYSGTFQIVSSVTRIAFLYIMDNFRVVPIGAQIREQDPDPRFMGVGYGRWEGDTLVIESSAFKDSKDGKLWIDDRANPLSGSAKVVERFTRPDLGHLKVHVEVDDPIYYTHSFSFDNTWVNGKPDEIIPEYACTENNIDAAHLIPGPVPIGPDGVETPFKPLPKTPPSPDAYDVK